jgi:cytochrome c peroxidase
VTAPLRCAALACLAVVCVAAAAPARLAPRATARLGRHSRGLWNVWANPDLPAPQAAIAEALGVVGTPSADVLPRTIAAFKTPGLRDLGQSAPYFHTGRMATLADVVRFYAQFSEKARLGRVRNASPDVMRIFIGEDDVAPLLAFLDSLNEDYR